MILVTDSETNAVIIDTDGDEGENRDAYGTYTGPGVVYGLVYHGVKAWIAPRSRVYDWEPEGDSVFVQYTDESSTRSDVPHSRVHTIERPLPGGGVARFLVTAE